MDDPKKESRPDPSAARVPLRRLAARIVLWFLLVVSVYFFIAVMFGGLRPDR